jgi:hypothetical protein
MHVLCIVINEDLYCPLHNPKEKKLIQSHYNAKDSWLFKNILMSFYKIVYYFSVISLCLINYEKYDEIIIILV